MDWIIPAHCISCQCQLVNGTYPCCSACLVSLPYQHHCCHRCGQVFAANRELCGKCLVCPPFYDSCFCPFSYAHPIDQQIRRLKYSERPELAKSLAALLAAELQVNDIAMPELLIPVPIHRHKLRERGFNQSWLLVQHLSHMLKIPCSNQHLHKHRMTAAQVQLPLHQRQQNTKDSFRVSRALTARHVALVDDVVTTGSTASEIAKILKGNGVNYVQIWGIAHSI